MKKLLFAAIAILGFSAVSFGQSTATATATATLIVPISIAKTVDMNFGTIGSSNTAGSVALSSASVATPSGGVTLITGGATRTAASFTVTGDGTSTFTVSCPTTINLTNTSPSANVLVVNGIAPDSGPSSALVAGSKTILVGGTLQVPANTVSGIYTNTTDLKVTVNYN